MKRMIFLAFLFVFSACSHSIHMVHTSDFTPYSKLKAGKFIKATSEQKSILGFNSDTNYVDEAYSRLKEKCKRGRIKGITTQFSTSHGFFHWTNKILMQGLCVRS